MLHRGRLNVIGKYAVNVKTLNSIEVQRDLGVQAHSFLKATAQVDRVAKMAHDMLAFISRCIEYKSQEAMLQLYRTLIGLH